MIFESIRLTNLFSYYGDQALQLGTPEPGRNVCLIMGRNGFGKTSLLNSLKLLFTGVQYEPLRRAVQRARMPTITQYVVGAGDDWWGIMNRRARREGATRCAVRLVWREDAGQVAVERAWNIENGVWDREESLTVTTANETFEDEEAQAFLDRRLPRDYVYFFLFDGEQIQELAEANRDIQQRQMERLLGIGAIDALREEDGPRISRYRVYLDDVNHYDRVKRGLDKLGLHLGLSTRQGILLEEDEDREREARVLALDVPRPRETWHTVPGSRLRDWATQATDVPTLTVWPGVDVLGEPVHFDLAAAPHLLVGGTTGSGKSVCLHALLLSLLWRLAPKDLQLTLIDPKRVELAHYAGFPHLIGGQIIEDIGDALEALDGLVVEMERRTVLLRQHGVANLAEGREQGRIDLPFVVAVVEELADLLFQSREAEAPLVRLTQKARAAGIHLVLATQRPDAETFSGLLRSNVPGRIALSVRTAAESKIILDETGAEKLLGSGDMLLRPQAGAPARRAHGVRVGGDDIRLCLQAVRGRSP